MFKKDIEKVLNEALAVIRNGGVILYPTDRHEILHEDDRERVFGDILRFLNSAIQQ